MSSLGCSRDHWQVRDVGNLQTTTSITTPMEVSGWFPPLLHDCFSLDIWSKCELNTTLNRTELKRKAGVSLRPFLWTHSFKMLKGKRWPLFFSFFFFIFIFNCTTLVWFWAAWGSCLTQLWGLMHFPVLGTLPQTISSKLNWPKKHWFYNTQTNNLLWWTTSKLIQKPQY